MAKELVISAEEVKKFYRLEEALTGFNLEVERGSIFALLGPNGAGKTTFIRCLLGLSQASEGKISLWDELEVCRPQVGYLPERFNFHGTYTAAGVLDFYARMRGVDSSEIKDRSNEALKKINMSEFLHKPLGQMSKGQRQRIGIASLLLAKNELIILDEPFSGLDPLGIKDLREIIKELNDEGTTIFLNSHILLEVENLCTHFAIINKGKCLSVGEKSEVLQGKKLEDYFYDLITGNEHD